MLRSGLQARAGGEARQSLETEGQWSGRRNYINVRYGWVTVPHGKVNLYEKDHALNDQPENH
jgi:hypothetical protein